MQMLFNGVVCVLIEAVDFTRETKRFRTGWWEQSNRNHQQTHAALILNIHLVCVWEYNIHSTNCSGRWFGRCCHLNKPTVFRCCCCFVCRLRAFCSFWCYIAGELLVEFVQVHIYKFMTFHSSFSSGINSMLCVRVFCFLRLIHYYTPIKCLISLNEAIVNHEYNSRIDLIFSLLFVGNVNIWCMSF